MASVQSQERKKQGSVDERDQLQCYQSQPQDPLWDLDLLVGNLSCDR